MLHAYDSTTTKPRPPNVEQLAGNRQFLRERPSSSLCQPLANGSLRRHAWEQYWGHYFFDHHSGELDVYGLLNGTTTPFAPILGQLCGAAYIR